MGSAYRRDVIENWVSDFVMSDGMRGFSGGVREVAGEVLVGFLDGACEMRDVEPAEIEERDVKESLLGDVARLNVAEDVKRELPGLCGAFLGQLEEVGRLGGGRVMGAYVRALGGRGGAFDEASSGKVKPVVRAGAKIGRNDPCPCGSGKKYKKCCGGN